MSKRFIKVLTSLCVASMMMLSACGVGDVVASIKNLEKNSLTEGDPAMVEAWKGYKFSYADAEAAKKGLEDVKGVYDIAAASENGDPEKMIHIGKGRTDVVYFSYEGIDQNSVDLEGDDYELNLHGGSVEIYEDSSFALARRAELLKEEGNGEHFAYIGRVIVRSSDKLDVFQSAALVQLVLYEMEEEIDVPADVEAEEESKIAATADTEEEKKNPFAPKDDTEDEDAPVLDPDHPGVLDYDPTDSTDDIEEPTSEAVYSPHPNDGVTMTYVCNTDTMKFHNEYCDSIELMKEENKKIVTDIRENLISEGYEPCLNCTP